MSEVEQSGKGTLRAALRHRQFRSLLGAYAISSTGDFVYVIAMVAYVFERTGSAGWVAAAGTVRIIPFVLFGPIGGSIAARYDRRRVMVVSDLMRAGVMAAMAAATAVDAPAAAVIAMAFVNNTATTPWRPAAAASTPAVVGEDDLAAANGAEATVNQLSMFVGPAIGAALFAATSAPIAFAVNGASFALSAVLISRVTSASQTRAPAATAVTADTVPATGWLAELGAGWRATRHTPGALLLQGLLVVVLFAYGFEVVLHALVAAERLGLGAEGSGYLLGAVGVGGLVIVPLSGRIAASRQSGVILAVATVLLGAPLALLAVVESAPVAYGLLLIEGAGTIVFEVLAITYLQRLVRGDDLARVFGLQDSLGAAAMIAGSLASPVLVETVGLSGALVVGGASVMVFGVLAAPPMARLGARLADEVKGLQPVVEELGHLGLLESASRAALERVAREIRQETVSAGQTVVTQGDAPDDLFVIRSGEFQVISRGERGQLHAAPSLEPGDWFGEIGLLHEVPRTATVTALTDGVLWRIPGTTFVEALTLLDARPASVEHRLTARLTRTHPSLLRDAEAQTLAVKQPKDF